MISFSEPLTFSGNYLVVIVAGFLVLCVCLCFFKGSKVQPSDLNIAPVEKYKANVRSFRSFFQSLLPTEYQYEPINVLFHKQLAAKHDLSTIWRDREASNDIIPLKLAVLAKILCMLGINVLLALLYFPASTACTNLHSQTSCSNSITISIIGSICTWDDDSQQCSQASTNELFAFTVFCALVAIVVTSFVDQGVKFLISHAVTAIKNKRLRWLYFCCVQGPPGRSRSLVFRAVKVTPSIESSNSSGVHINSDRNNLEAPARPAAANAHTQTNSVKAKPGTEASALREALRAQEEAAGLTHFGDEWTALAVQSRKATIMRAARYCIMKQRLDYTSTAQELHYLLHHSRERYLWMESADKPHKGSNWFNTLWRSFRLRQLSVYDIGDPQTCLELMDLAHLLHQPLIERKLSRSRARATVLRSRLVQLPDGPTRDSYLLQAFMVGCLSGHKRVVAQAVVFETDEVVAARELRVIWQYLALLLLPWYFVIALGIIFYGGLAVSAAASWVWLRCVLLTLAVNLFWQQPAAIWALHVWFPGAAKKDLLALHWVLQVRARSILSRRKGLLHSMNALVQHFNPACRAARLLPHLPVARLLLSLSDYDLPVSAVLHRPRRRSIRYPSAQVFNTGSPLVWDRCEYICINVYSRWRWVYNLANRVTMAVLRLLLHWLYTLPCWCREVLVEVTLTGALLGFLLALYSTNKISTDYTILLVIAVSLALSVAAYKIYRDWLRERQLLQRIEVQRVRYQLNCNPVAVSPAKPAVIGKERLIRSRSTIRQLDKEESKQVEIV